MTPSRPSNGFVRFVRKIYHPIGFKKGYNFTLFFNFGGALFGFALARLMYLDFDGAFCGENVGPNHAAPGECYWYQQGHYHIGMLLHLAAVLPSSVLAILQFIPVIRYKALLFHRINGYVITILTLVSIAGVFMITRHAFGGSLATQTGIGVLAVASLVSLALAIYNIKRLQIEQHRAWMLRLWAYMGSIITLRIIMIVSAQIISVQGDYYTGYPCAQLDSIVQDREATLQNFPGCAAFFKGSNPEQYVLVNANFNAKGDTAAVRLGVSMGIGFEMAVWLALVIHAVAVEVYLKLTPREFQRLRQISYQRQLEAGMKNPGSAGLTIDRLGDAQPWTPSTEDK